MAKTKKDNYGREKPGYKQAVQQRSRERAKAKKKKQDEFHSMFLGLGG